MKSHLKHANIDVETEEGCIRLLRHIKAEGGTIYYRSADNTNRLVISPSRKGACRSLAGIILYAPKVMRSVMSEA